MDLKKGDLYKRLLQDEELMANLIRDLMDVLVVIDRDAVIRFINRAGEDLLGYKASELVGKSVGLIISDDDLKFFKMIRELVQSGVSRHCDIYLVAKSGERITATFTGSVLRNSDRHIQAVVGVVRDMRKIRRLIEALEEAKSGLEEKVKARTTDLTKAYNGLRQAETQLVQAEKLSSLGQLAAGVAHEINIPVRFVKSNVGKLREYLEDIFPIVTSYTSLLSAIEKKDEEAVASMVRLGREQWESHSVDFLLKEVKTIVKESFDGLTRVEGIVRDLKEFSHVDRTERKLFNLNDGLESALKIMWNELEYKAEVIKELGEIPEILCYPQQLNQVFLNLLVNAGHAIEERGLGAMCQRPGVGGNLLSQRAELSAGKGEASSGLAGGGGTVAPPEMEKGKIWIRTFTRDGEIIVEVEDTGSGISSEHLKKIFDLFFTTKRVGQGTGLGLSISYGIVKRHKGKIDVESEVGKGTKFTIHLPVSEK